MGRVTINPGLRYERFVMSIPAQSAAAGRWVPAREFAAQENIVNWNSLSPRFGIVWDVFGNGRTAVKGGLSRYDRLAGITIIQPLNLKNIAFQTCPWADTNSDLRAQVDEIAMERCTGSLQPSLGFVDEGLKRPHQWEYTATVQRQIGANTSVMVGYYGRRFWNLYTTVNDAVPSTAYTPVTITNPLTNEPMTVYNQDPATRGQVRNVLKTIPDLKQRYHGVEFQFNTRLSNATVFGGLTIGNNWGDQDGGDLNNPNNRINNQGDIGFDAPYQIRGGFSYRLPAEHPVLGLASRGVRTAADAHLCRDDGPGAGPDAGHAKRAGGRTRGIPLSMGQPVGSRYRQDVPIRRHADSSRPPTSSTCSTTTRSPTRFKRSATSLGRPSAIVMGRLLRLGGRRDVLSDDQSAI